MDSLRLNNLGHWLWLAISAVLLSCGEGVGRISPSTGESGANRVASAGKSGWYAVQLHAHSTHSDGAYTVKQVIDKAKKEGLDALALSDHNTTMQWLDPSFLAENDVIMLHSEEAEDEKGINHMGLHGMVGIAPIVREVREVGLNEAVRRNATIIVNHPMNRFLPWQPLTLDSRVHAVEVWNSWYWNPVEDLSEDDPQGSSQNEKAISWWAAQVANGARVAPIAASDFHRMPQNVGSPCTLVYASDRSETGILSAIRQGRTILTSHSRGPRVEIMGDADFNGSFESMIGDTVPFGSPLRARVKRATGDVLRVIMGGQEVVKTKVEEMDWVYDFKLPSGIATKGRFIYARVDGDRPPRQLHSMTGALYLR